MGNKSSRHKSASDVPQKRKKQDKANGHNRDKHISCPDLGGATPYRLYDDEPKIKYNIYRSYRDLDNNKVKEEQTYDIKVYRRSTAGSPDGSPSIRRPTTLPRSFGRSKSAFLPGKGGDVTTPNGGLYMDWERAGAPTPDSEYGTLRSGRSSRMSARRSRSSIASSVATTIKTPTKDDSLKRISQGAATSPIDPAVEEEYSQVSPGDFPTTDEIKHKLKYFEEQFARCLVAKYRLLPESDQLASLALAMRKRFGQMQTITLADYMDSDHIPVDLLSPQESYILCVPQALFHGIAHVREKKDKDVKMWTSLASDLVMCVGIEAANELSRMYEYQIALMFDEPSIRILANHAAECAVDYVRNNTYMDRNAAIQGVVKNYPPNPDGLPKYLAVVLGDKEMKWELYDIFKKCGLRKEISLVSDKLILDPDEESIDPDPWTFHYSNGTEPAIYGYRGQLIEWDFVNLIYRLDAEDEERFEEEIIWRPEDFHRMYMPYRRLVGLQAMKAFTNLPPSNKRSLCELLKVDFDGLEDRDEIQPVYRPLAAPVSPAEIRYSHLNLDNMDLARAQLGEADFSGSTMENVKMLHVDASTAKLARSISMKGADLSFSTLDNGLNPERVEGMTAKSVVILTSSPIPVEDNKFQTFAKGTKLQLVNGVDDTDGVFQETNLDDSLPVSEINPNEEEIVVPVTHAAEKQTAVSFVVSNSAGQILPVDQIIQEKKEALEKEETQLSSGVPSPDSLSSPVNTSVVRSVSQERLRAEKKKKKRAKQQRRSQQQQQHPHDLNASAASRQDYSLNSSIASAPENKTRSVPRLQRTTAVDYDQSPQLEDKVRSSSSSNITYTANGPQNGYPLSNGDFVVEEAIRPMSAAPAQAATLLRDPSRRESPKTRSLSSSNIHQRQTYNGSEFLHDTSLPPMRGSRATSTLPPRIIKSISHHGGNWKTASIDYRDSRDLGFVPLGARQTLKGEVEQIRRSQIFTIMKGLQIRNLEDNLPDLGHSFLGRDSEVEQVTDLLAGSGRIVTLCGGAGVGKSTLAMASAMEMHSRSVVPIYFDCRGCKSTESVWIIMNQTFNLHLKIHELTYLYNWINCHEQKLLFLFDNIEIIANEESKFSELLDDLVMNVKNLRVMCTSSRNFFHGQTRQDICSISNVRRDISEQILSCMIPDLHEEGVQQLAEAADYILQGLVILARSFRIENIDSGKLFEDLTSPTPNEHLPLDNLEDVLSENTDDDVERQALARLAVCVRVVLENFTPKVRDLLCKLSYASSFNLDMAFKMSNSELGDEEQVHAILHELANCNLLIAVTKNGGRFFMPKVVRVVINTCWPDDGSNSQAFMLFFVNLLKTLCVQYHSKNCHDALQMVIAEYDNIIDALNRVLEREDTYDLCSDFASPEYAMFLYEVLPRELYEDLYDSLVQQCEEQDDVLKQAYSLCCSAYCHFKMQELEPAKVCAERAYAMLQNQGNVKERERAFCAQCLGNIYYLDPENKERGVLLVKRALDTYKLTLGVRHLRTLYANEDYGQMLIDKGSFQTARHFYNISDFVVRELLDIHPLLLDGYNCRRMIWDKLCLFARTTEVAQKAADTAQLYFSDHPLTAKILSQLCDAIMRRGSLNDALQTAVAALAIRVKVLGDHEDTGSSYKTVAYLMSRSSQYDEACRFGQNALDIFDKVGAPDKLVIETKNLIAQCRFKLDCKSTKFVELESKDASKRNVVDSHNSTAISGISTEV